MGTPDQSPEAEAVVESFEKQIQWCRSLGSPFTALLLDGARADLAPGGRVATLLGEWPGDPVADALPLRFAGALHALVLTGQAPGLAACYPPNPMPDANTLARAVQNALAERHGFVADFLLSPPQTNEVGRSGVLLGGFLDIAASAGPRLRLLEIGASAGLNLMWDRYRYSIAGAAWGDAASPVLLAPAWTGPRPKLGAPVEVIARAACDAAPVDLADPAQRLRLNAFIWPDQIDRLARLNGAIGVARAAAVQVARADAAAWVPVQLADLPADCTTVLFHSIMWQYMPTATRQSIAASIAAAGARATPDARLAWLRFEPAQAGARAELSLNMWPGTMWPGNRQAILATAHAHGTTVEWLGSAF